MLNKFIKEWDAAFDERVLVNCVTTDDIRTEEYQFVFRGVKINVAERVVSDGCETKRTITNIHVPRTGRTISVEHIAINRNDAEGLWIIVSDILVAIGEPRLPKDMDVNMLNGSFRIVQDSALFKALVDNSPNMIVLADRLKVPAEAILLQNYRTTMQSEVQNPAVDALKVESSSGCGASCKCKTKEQQATFHDCMRVILDSLLCNNKSLSDVKVVYFTSFLIKLTLTEFLNYLLQIGPKNIEYYLVGNGWYVCLLDGITAYDIIDSSFENSDKFRQVHG